ncbi:MAG: Zn-dependent hydrolase [Acidobacteriota bacterium]
MEDLGINFERLKKDICELGEIGCNLEGGISRPSFSRADLKARDWFKKKIQEAGLILREDGAGNIFGRVEGKGKTVMTGSHLDTVVNGGKFDGSAGVLAGLECLRIIKEENISISKPIEVASFTDEEGNLTGDFLGSRAFTGTLNKEQLQNGRTQFGLPLSEILKNTPFTLESILEADKDRPEIEAFLELHIEQGDVLESEGKSIGIVDRFAGKQDWACAFIGEASHAGTTPFELRHDAFLGLADLALKATHYVAKNHYGSLLTVGQAKTFPGNFSTIPGRVEFTLDFRSTSPESLQQISSYIQETAHSIAQTRGLSFQFKIVDQTEPVEIPFSIATLLGKKCDQLGYEYMRLPSRAGHDTQILSQITKSGLIFIPCQDGISHSPAENILWEDLEKGSTLLLKSLLSLAS